MEERISLIITDNFPKEIRIEENELFLICNEKNDNDAFDRLKQNIDESILFSAILSGHKTVEDTYGLLKSFLDYNIDNDIENSNYPFFIFIENDNLNKKKLYSYYLEQEKERKDFEENFVIDSKIILFINVSENINEKLNYILNYYHRKNVQIKNYLYSSPYIKIMFVGATGTGKSTMLNELNGQKLAYSSCENQTKTQDNQNGKTLMFKNKRYPILNQDTEGFEIADNSQIEKVNNNVNKNISNNLNERLHIVIYLFKNGRGLDFSDIEFFVKLHELKILYYGVDPRNEGKDKILRDKAKRLIKDLIKRIKNNNYNETINNLFNKFSDKNHLIELLNEMMNMINRRFFSSNILSKTSKGKVNLLQQIKTDLFEIKRIHESFIQKIDQLNFNDEKMRISISGNILKKDTKNYYQILDDSPFFYKYSLDDIKRQEAEKLLKDVDVSAAWLFWYNSKVENLRKDILKKIQMIYSDVKINVEVDNKIYDTTEKHFYKTEKTKIFIKQLIDFYAEKYKEIGLNQKYYTACKDYNKSIEEFGKYVKEFSNSKLKEEPILYDLDLV